jgi:hypothetical protein
MCKPVASELDVPVPVAVLAGLMFQSAVSPAVAPPEPYAVRSKPTMMVLLDVPVPLPVAVVVRVVKKFEVAVSVPSPEPVAVRWTAVWL